MRRRSVAIVTNKGSTYPPTNGAARRIWGLARALDHVGFRVHVIESSVDRVVHHQQVGEIRVTSFPFPAPRRFRTTLGAARAFRTASSLNRIIGSRPWFNPKHTAYLAKLRFRSMLDVAQIEFPYPMFEAIPLRGLGARLVLDQHGVEVDFLSEILASIDRSAMLFESVQVSFVERVAIQAAASVLCCSEHDRARMLNLYGGRPSKYVVVENGIDEEFFEPVEPIKFSAPIVLFLGSFNHSPNLYAIDWIMQYVFPRVRRVLPEAEFVFVGSGSVELPQVNGAVVIRDVKDVRPFIRGAQVGLGTVFHGSGSRLKILEYLACGLPVVASTKGVEGLDLVPGSDVLVANDPDSIAVAIVELLTNKSLSKELAANALSKVRSRYTWRAIVSKALPTYLA